MEPNRHNEYSHSCSFYGPVQDNEVKGVGNSQNYGKRIYDNRLGRFLSVDPLFRDYPMLTPYQFASNTPIQAIDLDGMEAAPFQHKWDFMANYYKDPAIRRVVNDEFMVGFGIISIYLSSGASSTWIIGGGMLSGLYGIVGGSIKSGLDVSGKTEYSNKISDSYLGLFGKPVDVLNGTGKVYENTFDLIEGLIPIPSSKANILTKGYQFIQFSINLDKLFDKKNKKSTSNLIDNSSNISIQVEFYSPIILNQPTSNDANKNLRVPKSGNINAKPCGNAKKINNGSNKKKKAKKNGKIN